MLGFLPGMLSEKDERSAKEQFQDTYRHGGGWSPLKGWRMLNNGDIIYPGDPPLALLAEVKLRKETIRLYEHAWVMILQEDGSFELSRMD